MTEKTDKPKFKVGDTVKVVKTYRWNSYEFKGKFGIITEISPNKKQGNLYWVNLINTKGDYCEGHYSRSENYRKKNERLYFEEEIKAIAQELYDSK